MIVWLASYPRSGNTLARLALFHLYGRRSASFYPGAATGPPTTGQLTLRSLIDRRPLDLLQALDGPVFVKTHELRHARDYRPAVVVVRDGRDALVSYAHFLLDQGSEPGGFERLLGNLIRGPAGSTGTWSESVVAWRRRSAPTALIRFEDLQASPASTLKRAAEEVGLDLGERRGQIPAFPGLHEAEPELFRRGRVGAWRDEMPPRVEELFWSRHGTTMEALGYERGH